MGSHYVALAVLELTRKQVELIAIHLPLLPAAGTKGTCHYAQYMSPFQHNCQGLSNVSHTFLSLKEWQCLDGMVFLIAVAQCRACFVSRLWCLQEQWWSARDMACESLLRPHLLINFPSLHLFFFLAQLYENHGGPPTVTQKIVSSIAWRPAALVCSKEAAKPHAQSSSHSAASWDPTQRTHNCLPARMSILQRTPLLLFTE